MNLSGWFSPRFYNMFLCSKLETYIYYMKLNSLMFHRWIMTFAVLNIRHLILRHLLFETSQTSIALIFDKLFNFHSFIHSLKLNKIFDVSYICQIGIIKQCHCLELI